MGTVRETPRGIPSVKALTLTGQSVRGCGFDARGTRAPHSPFRPDSLVVLFPFRTGTELLPTPVIELSAPVTLTGEVPQLHNLPTVAGSTHCPTFAVPLDVINHTPNIHRVGLISQ